MKHDLSITFAKLGSQPMTNSDALVQNYKKTLLGRLKLALYNLICGTADSIPAGREIREFLLDTYKETSHRFADILRHLLALSIETSASWVDLRQISTPEALINDLECHPLESPLFVELTEFPDPFPSTVGVLIEREALDPSGHLYTMTFMEESSFPLPKSFVGRLEFSPSSQEGAFCAVLEKGRFVTYDKRSFISSPLARAAVNILSNLTTKRKFGEISPEEAARVEWEDRLEPPHDGHLMNLLSQLLNGEITCKRAISAISEIRPHSLDFCLSYPVDMIESAKAHIRESNFHPPLLVYWHQNSFVMSDDYGFYLAYRSLDTELVPIIALGDVPSGMPIEAEGGAELLPPVIVNNYGESNLDPATKDLLLTRKLSQSSRPPILGLLYALHIELSRLLQGATASERDLHNFLHKHSIAVSPFGLRIETEVALGKEFRIDLLIQTPGLIPQILLIELESANKELFTKADRPRSTTTHAIQQVEDWLRWWSEHPTELPVNPRSSLPPNGMVVIGRSKRLGEADRRRLVHLNNNRRVQVLTYDELALQLEAYIKNLEDLQAWR